MTQREKILAIGVAASLLIVGGFYALNKVTTKFDARYDTLAQLDDQIATQDRTILQGRAAAKKLEDWKARALPEDIDVARTLYLDWLRERAVAVQLDGPKITPAGGRQEGKYFYRMPFVVSGRGDLRQLTQFLYDFYSVDMLHRISRLNVKPIQNSKQLDLSITIDALSMAGVPNKTLAQPPANRLAYENVSDYVDPILSRNMFAPANKPPRLSSLGTEQGNPNRPLSYRVQASDPEQDQLTYEVEGELPAGATFDGRSGELKWTPSELGTFEVAFRASDGRNSSEVGTLKIAVVEPPPPRVEPPGFDPATQAAVSAITASAGRPELWINVRTEGKILRLAEGDSVSVGSVKGEITKIDAIGKTAEIATPDGRTIYVSLGKMLAGENSGDLGGI